MKFFIDLQSLGTGLDFLGQSCSLVGQLHGLQKAQITKICYSLQG